MVFVDSNVIVYAATGTDHPLRRGSADVIEAIAAGEIDGRTSAAVIEEVWHLELLGRPIGLEGVAIDAHQILAPLLAITDDIVADGLGCARSGRR